MAKEKQNQPQYAPPASQVDLEARLANGNQSGNILSTADSYPEAVEGDENAREFVVEGNETDDYINVDPIYQNYANETEAPYRATEGPEADLESIVHGEAMSTPDGVITVEEAQELSDQKAAERDADDDESDDEVQLGSGDQTGPDTPNA